MKRTNLILMDCADTDRESYRVRMITLCGVKGFLPCRLQEVDGKLLYCYDVTSKIPLRSLFENKNIGKNILEKLFRSLSEALENLGECLLPEDGILLDPEYIYTDAEQKEILYCYCPGVETTFEEEMKELGEYLLPRLDHEDTDAVIMAYSFYQQTVSGEGLSSDLFRELIGKGSMENAKDPIFLTPEEEEERQKHEKLMDSFFSDDEADADRPGAVEKGRKTHGFANFWDQFVQFFHRWKKRKFREEDYPELRADRESEFLAAEESGYYNEEKKAGKVTAGKTTTGNTVGKMEIPETRAEAGDSETVFLGALTGDAGGNGFCPRLIPADKEAEIILLTGRSQLIGKNRDAADIVLPSPAVSRIHARIYRDGDAMMIEDLNSKNGTFLQSEILTPGEPRQLTGGEEIRFANLAYHYRDGV